MKFATKNTMHGKHRTHVMVDNKPVCGGGNGARTAQWQETFVEADCARCLAILERRKS